MVEDEFGNDEAGLGARRAVDVREPHGFEGTIGHIRTVPSVHATSRESQSLPCFRRSDFGIKPCDLKDLASSHEEIVANDVLADVELIDFLFAGGPEPAPAHGTTPRAASVWVGNPSLRRCVEL